MDRRHPQDAYVSRGRQPRGRTTAENNATIVAVRRESFFDTAMFVIELIYKATLNEIDASMAAHVRFLKKYYAAGNFLVSGRKIPRDGGIILAVGESREQIETIMREDPFCQRGLADFRVIEFRASQRAPDIQKRIES